MRLIHDHPAMCCQSFAWFHFGIRGQKESAEISVATGETGPNLSETNLIAMITHTVNSAVQPGFVETNRPARARRAAWFLIFFAACAVPKLFAVVDLAIGVNFPGSVLGTDVFANPADANGTVGPQHFVEFINGRFAIYSKTTGALVTAKTDGDFWVAAGVQIPTGYGTTDPRLIYDPTVGRWFASQIDYNSNANNTNRFLLAVSATSDPTGVWKGLALASDPARASFADFPTLGVNRDAVFLSGLYFALAGGTAGSVLISIPKADLLLATPTTANRTIFSPLPEATHGVIFQPAVNLNAGSADANVLTVPHDGTDLVAQSSLLRFTIQNAAGPGAASLSTPTAITVPTYTVPLNPAQPSGDTSLDDGDNRFSAPIFQVGNVLYGVHGVQVSTHPALRWYKINATDGTLLQSGTIADANLAFFYPSIAANSNGLVVIAFNGCGAAAGAFVSSYAVAADTVHGYTSFGAPVRLKAGTASYSSPGSDGTSRWGDYSAISLDPSDPTRFWTIQMVPSARTTWFNQITEIRLTARPNPTLTITRNAGNVTVSWPATATGFHLESATNLAVATPWTSFVLPPSTNAGTISVTTPAALPQQFFQLRSP